MSQLALSFATRHNYRREDFIVSPCNQEAWSWVEAWPRWPAHGLVVYGPKACGKTHLAHIWAEKNDAMFISPAKLRQQSNWLQAGNIHCMVLEAVEKVEDEEALFHLLNSCHEQKTHLLLTSEIAPNHYTFRLQDLRSRLLALPAVEVKEPDDAVLSAVLFKHFADRQLRVGAEVVDYIVTRIERSFAAAAAIAARLDDAALAAKRNITLPLARTIVENELTRPGE